MLRRRSAGTAQALWATRVPRLPGEVKGDLRKERTAALGRMRRVSGNPAGRGAGRRAAKVLSVGPSVCQNSEGSEQRTRVQVCDWVCFGGWGVTI